MVRVRVRVRAWGLGHKSGALKVRISLGGDWTDSLGVVRGALRNDSR